MLPVNRAGLNESSYEQYLTVFKRISVWQVIHHGVNSYVKGVGLFQLTYTLPTMPLGTSVTQDREQ